jgi:hypothetical protein
VLSLASYHANIPYIKAGVAQKKEDGTPVFIKERCLGKTCPHCAAHGKPTLTNGLLRKLVLTGTHFNQLMNYNRKLSDICSGCGKTIVLNDYSCQKCNFQLLNVAEGRYSSEFLEKYATTPQMCPNPECNHSGLPTEGLDCGYDEEGLVKEVEDCPLDYPVRMTIFNTVIPLTKEGEKVQSKLDFGDKKSILDKSRIRYNHPSKLSIEELIKAALVDTKGELFDLENEVRICGLDEQAAILGVENPFAEIKLPNTGAVSQTPHMPNFSGIK